MTYESRILNHYAEVARQSVGRASSTMEDNFIRSAETEFICDSVNYALSFFRRASRSIGPAKLLDVGCGDGFTLSTLETRNSSEQLQTHGLEFTPELRSLANARGLRCHVEEGDIRDRKTIPNKMHVIIMQRVLINLLDSQHQAVGLANVISALEVGGFLISLETFERGREKLNGMREEFGLHRIPPAVHNLDLHHSLFERNTDLVEVEVAPWKAQHLSTHYVISRVMHDIALKAAGSDFKRNSLFVAFMDGAILPGIGSFSPLEFRVFQKVGQAA